MKFMDDVSYFPDYDEETKVETLSGYMDDAVKAYLGQKLLSSLRLFSPLQCTVCASAMRKALQARGISGEVLNITADGGQRFIVNDLVSSRMSITQNGFHQAIRAGDTVFDNFLREGVPYDEYMESLHAPLGVKVEAKPF